MNANIKMTWAGTCLPAKIFPIVMAGVVLFNLWVGVWGEAVKNFIFGFLGTGALYLLCASNMELLAYIILAIPVIFAIFLAALILFDQTLLQVTHSYKKPRRRCHECDQCDDCDPCMGSNC